MIDRNDQAASEPVANDMQDSSGVDQVPVEQYAEPVQEKMVPQSELNRIIGKVRSDAEQKAYARAQKELSERQQPATSVGGMRQRTEEEINALIDQRVDERSQQAYAQQLVQDFTQKIRAGVEKYSDFDDVVSDLNLASNPHLVRWANGLDNTADVLYDLGKSPEKFASVMMLASSSPNLALKKLKQLSESIKRNDSAKSADTADAPIDHLKPTNNGTDSGQLSVSDFQNLDWLRG